MPPLRLPAIALLFLMLAPLASAQTLRWATRGDAQTMDPHAAFEGVTMNLNALVYDRLVSLDRQGRIQPALATSWAVVEPTLWRFTLRRGVRFQDGTPFTADDVVFSIERAQQPGSRYAGRALPLGKPVRVDEHTVELRQARPHPNLLGDLYLVFMMSRRWATAHGAERVPDLKAGDEAYSNRHAMGTGPYLLRQYEPGVRTLLSRHTGWWNKFEGNVEQVIFLPILNDSTRSAALLGGDVELVQDVPPQDAQRLPQQPGLRLLSGPENRLILLGFDQSRDELLYANLKGRNPFKDARVRRAFSLAIDRAALKDKIMQGHSRPTACVAGLAASCLAPAAEPAPPPDLATARALMAQAGYPRGFGLTLDCPNDRYVNDRPICVAVASMLARINVTVRVDAIPKASYFPKLQRYDTSFYLHGWASPAADPQDMLEPLTHSVDTKTRRGDANYGRIADPELDRLLDSAALEMNPARREALLASAQQRVFEQSYLLPLHQQSLLWASRANVHAVMTPDNQVRVDWVRID